MSHMLPQHAEGSTLQETTDKIVNELKSRGIFDTFRKECLADVDTRPAYQNLRQRVDSTVTMFLGQQKWTPGLNRNQLREKLRKHLAESRFLEMGVDRIVDQVVDRNIYTTYMPQIVQLVNEIMDVKEEKEEAVDDDVEMEDALAPAPDGGTFGTWANQFHARVPEPPPLPPDPPPPAAGSNSSMSISSGSNQSAHSASDAESPDIRGQMSPLSDDGKQGWGSFLGKADGLDFSGIMNRVDRMDPAIGQMIKHELDTESGDAREADPAADAGPDFAAPAAQEKRAGSRNSNMSLEEPDGGDSKPPLDLQSFVGPPEEPENSRDAWRHTGDSRDGREAGGYRSGRGPSRAGRDDHDRDGRGSSERGRRFSGEEDRRRRERDREHGRRDRKRDEERGRQGDEQRHDERSRHDEERSRQGGGDRSRRDDRSRHDDQRSRHDDRGRHGDDRGRHDDDRGRRDDDRHRRDRRDRDDHEQERSRGRHHQRRDRDDDDAPGHRPPGRGGGGHGHRGRDESRGSGRGGDGGSGQRYHGYGNGRERSGGDGGSPEDEESRLVIDEVVEEEIVDSVVDEGLMGVVEIEQPSATSKKDGGSDSLQKESRSGSVKEETSHVVKNGDVKFSRKDGERLEAKGEDKKKSSSDSRRKDSSSSSKKSSRDHGSSSSSRSSKDRRSSDKKSSDRSSSSKKHISSSSSKHSSSSSSSKHSSPALSSDKDTTAPSRLPTLEDSKSSSQRSGISSNSKSSSSSSSPLKPLPDKTLSSNSSSRKHESSKSKSHHKSDKNSTSKHSTKTSLSASKSDSKPASNAKPDEVKDRMTQLMEKYAPHLKSRFSKHSSRPPQTTYAGERSRPASPPLRAPLRHLIADPDSLSVSSVDTADLSDFDDCLELELELTPPERAALLGMGWRPVVEFDPAAAEAGSGEDDDVIHIDSEEDGAGAGGDAAPADGDLVAVVDLCDDADSVDSGFNRSDASSSTSGSAPRPPLLVDLEPEGGRRRKRVDYIALNSGLDGEAAREEGAPGRKKRPRQDRDWCPAKRPRLSVGKGPGEGTPPGAEEEPVPRVKLTRLPAAVDGQHWYVSEKENVASLTQLQDPGAAGDSVRIRPSLAV